MTQTDEVTLPRSRPDSSIAFEPYALGHLRLKNRIVMAPMTRSRALGPGAIANVRMATYYAQRASAGLIVTEGIQPSIVGQGYPDTPGLHCDEQIASWRAVTDAVHRAGGLIFAQLMHAGRVGHADLLPGELIPVGPSAVAATGRIYTHAGPQPFTTPHPLSASEIEATIADHVAAARGAVAANFDGVELHCANGYLIHQFLSDNANLRTDRWGGSIENRIRFAADLTAAVVGAIGGARVGVRISPGNSLNDIVEHDPGGLYPALVARLTEFDLAYIHLAESTGGRELTERLRDQWPETFILNPATSPGHTGPQELELIAGGTADLISFGTLFVANPDLPARLAAGGPFNTPDRATYFGGDERGYTDYPTLV